MKQEPINLVKLKNQNFYLDAHKSIWCFPEFTPHTHHHPEPAKNIKDSQEPTEEDDSDFNDLETDERINIDIVRFDNSFPDPSLHCLGFLTGVYT